MPKNLEKFKEPTESVTLTDEEKKVKDWLDERLPQLKETKKQILQGINFEDIMRQADREYQPRFLKEKATRGSVTLIEDELTGVRGSRIVQIGTGAGQQWRSDLSEPTLMVKIQTALSVLIDQNPEAVFKALSAKYQNSTDLAKALWKRNWNVSKAKEQLKLFVFDLAKYGWAVGYTYPRLVRRKAEILEELDIDNPDNNKYREVIITDYNDVYREKLDPYRTWIDDMANLVDREYSVNDWYFEKDFTLADFRDDGQFAIYENSKFVKGGSKAMESDNDDENDGNQQTKERTDIVTVGFYENRSKDLYTIWIPDQHLPLYVSPLPNDDKKLSLWHAPWNMRDPRTPYGIGIYELLKHNKVMYDRLENMTIDQLTMAIYPMIFYSGSNKLQGTGDMTLSPALIRQKAPGTQIEQVKIDYDPRGIDGVRFQAERMDENTGITPTLEGQITGKTLGEVLQAKEAALKRLTIPLENIASALETDAQLTLSWMNQMYSVPDVIEFADIDDLRRYEEETGKSAVQVIDGDNSLFKGEEINDVQGGIKADFFPVLDLPLANAGKSEGQEDRNGNLIESPDNRFFRLGIDIDTSQVKWEGIVKITPRSILSPFPELERQRKMELFQTVSPVVQQIIQLLNGGVDKEGNPIPPNIPGAKALFMPLKQILEIQDEKPAQWIPSEFVKILEAPAKEEQKPLFTKPGGGNAPMQPEIPGQSSGGGLFSKIAGGLKGGVTGGQNNLQ